MPRLSVLSQLCVSANRSWSYSCYGSETASESMLHARSSCTFRFSWQAQGPDDAAGFAEDCCCDDQQSWSVLLPYLAYLPAGLWSIDACLRSYVYCQAYPAYQRHYCYLEGANLYCDLHFNLARYHLGLRDWLQGGQCWSYLQETKIELRSS